MFGKKKIMKGMGTATGKIGNRAAKIHNRVDEVATKLHGSADNVSAKMDGADAKYEALINTNEKELEKIKHRLDPDEEILMRVTQTATLIMRSTIFATDKRILIRTPKNMGFAEGIEEYTYDQITSVTLDKGMLSSAIRFTVPGLTEISKLASKFGLLRGGTGTIEGIPRGEADKLFKIMREKVREAKERKKETSTAVQQTPLDLLKTKFVNNEISAEEYEIKKKVLEG